MNLLNGQKSEGSHSQEMKLEPVQDDVPGKVRVEPVTPPPSSSEVSLGELRMDDKVWSLASIEEAGPLFEGVLDTREILFLAQALVSGDLLDESLLGKPSDARTESRRL